MFTKIKLIIGILSLVPLLVTSQNKTAVPKTNIVLYQKVYTTALQLQDAETALQACHYIIATEGGNSTYKDSLAILYFKSNKFISSYLLTNELLQKKPKDLTLLEINAVSIQNLGDLKKAATSFETLFGLTKNQYFGYQLAVLQMDLKRLGEAKTTVAQTILCEDIKDAKLQFSVDKEKNQNIALKAAILNLKGLIAFQLKDTAGSLKAFEEAIALEPDFALAKLNKTAAELELKK